MELFKSKIVTNVYHIIADRVVNLHKHTNHDEVFYCINGTGYGVLLKEEIELTRGKAFIVPAGTMHSLRTDGNLWVSSILIPVLAESL